MISQIRRISEAPPFHIFKMAHCQTEISIRTAEVGIPIILENDENVGSNDMCVYTSGHPFDASRGPCFARSTSANIDLATTPKASGNATAAILLGEVNPTPDVSANGGMQATKQKKKKRKGKKNVAPVTPTLSALRCFTPTPSASGDDSDFSTYSFKRQPISSASSPGLRPTSSCGGISALRMKLDALNIEPSPLTPALERFTILRSEAPSSPGTQSTAVISDGESSDLTSYEVPLHEEYVSSEALKADEASGAMDIEPSKTVHKMAAEDFEPLSCLGKGSYGTVLLVRQKKTGRLYAQKQFKKASLNVHKHLIEQAKTERDILESINSHAFVVKLYYAFQDHAKLYLILEYAQGGELFTYLKHEKMFPEDKACFYMAEMVLALEHLHHTVGVVYRDLKPENCLLDAEGHLLLTDFGLSKKRVDGERCTSFSGTVEYMAPEVILGQGHGMQVDWWSLGAVGVDLLTGAPPFQGSNTAKIKQRICEQKLALPYYLGPDAKDLLIRLLRKDPKRRLGGTTPKDLLALKKHRFFRKIDWERLEKRELEAPIRPFITEPENAEAFAREFTQMPLSPVVSRAQWRGEGKEERDPFGGFSFVASQSMIDEGDAEESWRRALLRYGTTPEQMRTHA